MTRLRKLLAIDALDGAGPVFIRRLVQRLGGWEIFDHATNEQILQCLRQSGGDRWAAVTPAAWETSLRTADMAMAGIQACGARTLVHGDRDWPEQLDRLRDAPLWLHVRGDASLLCRRSVAIIGTRSPTMFGAACAHRFGRRAAEAGAVVVSGLALGADTQAHAGCLEGGGRTMAILPVIDPVLPTSNQGLARKMIAADGCLVSEHAPEQSAELEKWRFIHRDRLQAGVSAGVILVEAGLGSGARHCVEVAIKSGIPLACLMRDAPDWLACRSTEENQRLVAAGLAVPLRTADDLVAWFRSLGLRGE